ncbi:MULTISPECIES: ABC transporter ATP-binding protein [Actinosynnema]|uniref:ABC transporter ATP-binding protein n=1 Tax=Actinosynnema TaxID=40566 RepID=UPI0020A5237A|nr:ABC transporter ATP-binding protein [Actinosynnema pretiosum]MCP2092124.1 ABC-2 type transport system ATP-binding protein [Actinosynnema pretiosum]
MSEPAYELHEVTKSFKGKDSPANDRISLTVARGEFFGLLGSNGAGKSTLIKQMVGLLRSDSGAVRFLGRPVPGNQVFVGTRLGYMPQSAFALNNLTVAEAVYYTAHLRGVPAREARRQRDELVERLELGPLRDKVARQLSGGERRLLQLAVAVVSDPPVLILDEPTNELDPARRRQVWALLREANRERGRTIVLITHNALEAEQVIERVGIMSGGRMVALGRPGELKSRVAGSFRLDVTFREEGGRELPDYVVVESRHRDRVTAHVAAADVARLTADLAPETVLEFRLHSATLEDVYLDHVR